MDGSGGLRYGGRKEAVCCVCGCVIIGAVDVGINEPLQEREVR